MSNTRREAILSLIENQDIETQQELTVALAKIGFEVTQATVSRDIKELKLLKQQNAAGRYVYTKNAPHAEKNISENMNIILSRGVVGIDYALNTVVIRTLTGMAQGVAAAIDAMQNRDILGSIAGDDKIIIIARSEKYAQTFCKNLKKTIA